MVLVFVKDNNNIFDQVPPSQLEDRTLSGVVQSKNKKHGDIAWFSKAIVKEDVMDQTKVGDNNMDQNNLNLAESERRAADIKENVSIPGNQTEDFFVFQPNLGEAYSRGLSSTGNQGKGNRKKVLSVQGFCPEYFLCKKYKVSQRIPQSRIHPAPCVPRQCTGSLPPLQYLWKALHKSSLHENVVFSVCARMGNAVYFIFIMWSSISGLDI